MPCTHELWDMETACADGMCPLCLAADLARVRALVEVYESQPFKKDFSGPTVARSLRAALEGRDA